MKLLYLMAKTFGGRPSAYVGLADEWAAYQLDAAVLMVALDDDETAAKSGNGPVSYDWGDLVG